ncbi:MAG: hypothetical protein EOP35_07410 [Rubrivivax sp.]|nr:MAG: hypothetical protein EOP35_07410 [Rubrivivax sp.]
MSGTDPAPARKGLFEFLDSKFGFWLVTTLFVAVWSSSYAAIDRYMHKDEAERTRAAESARRDMDAVLKVVPLLFADDAGQQDLAVKLLLSLRSKKALEDDSLALVQAVLDARLKTGSGAGATDNERRQAALILKAEDGDRIAAIANPTAASATPAAMPPTLAVARQLNDAELPPRVYLQIGDEADRDVAKRLRSAFASANVLAPGIELVDARHTPDRSDLRYCADKLDASALARVSAVLQQSRVTVANRPLPPAACRSVRFNHMELWLQRGASAAASG